MATPDDCDVPWPSVAGPVVPDWDSSQRKTSTLDINTSLSLLRRELASMQLQDRGLHKQLLELNSSIRDLKKHLDDSWDIEDHSDTNSISNQSRVDATESDTIHSTPSEPLNTQVSHSKQDSGILTDEDSSEENDIFENDVFVRGNSGQLSRDRSASAICLGRSTYPEVDVNQNIQNTAGRYSFRGYNPSILSRIRSHTVGETQFHRVTSMPVITEDHQSATTSSKVVGKAFAIYGYLNRPASPTDKSPQHEDFRPLARHGSMPVISSCKKTTVRHIRSGTVPFHKRIENKSGTRNSPQPDLKSTSTRTNKNNKPLYRIWRSSSQISLV